MIHREKKTLDTHISEGSGRLRKLCSDKQGYLSCAKMNEDKAESPEE